MSSAQVGSDLLMLTVGLTHCAPAGLICWKIWRVRSQASRVYGNLRPNGTNIVEIMIQTGASGARVYEPVEYSLALAGPSEQLRSTARTSSFSSSRTPLALMSFSCSWIR